MLCSILTKIQEFGDVWESTLCAGVDITHHTFPQPEVAGTRISAKSLSDLPRLPRTDLSIRSLCYPQKPHKLPSSLFKFLVEFQSKPSFIA